MLAAACVFAALAALVHVYIFVLESLRWEHPATRRVFGTSAESAAMMAPMAYNQGFYNLFLALGAGGGVVVVFTNRDAGVALLLLAVGSMLAAAVVLVGSDRSRLRPATVQGLFPALSLACLLVWALT